jgi:hypothetical protein
MEKLGDIARKCGTIQTVGHRSTYRRLIASTPLFARPTSVSDDFLYGCSFANRHDINTLRISLYTEFCRQAKHVLCVTVCSSSTIVEPENGIFPLAIREGWYEIHFIVNVWASLFGDIVVSPCLVRNRLIAKKYRNSLQNVLPGLLEGRGRDCGSSVK